jgi:hypothetical protein
MPRANRRRFFLSVLPRFRARGTGRFRLVRCLRVRCFRDRRNEKKNGFGFGRAIFGFND